MRNLMSVNISLLCAVICVMSAVITKRGTEGGNDTIQCPYDRRFETHQKYLSKGIWANRVDVIKTQTHQHPAWTHKGRFSLYDDTERRVFTVTITNLVPEDSGTYWCEINTWWWYHKTEVRITVDRAPVPPNPDSITSRPLLSTTHPSTNITMATDSSNSTAVAPTTTIMKTKTTAPPTTTFLSLSSPSSSSSSPSSFSPASSLNGSGTSEVIMVSVSLVVLLLLISLILFYRWKYNKATGSVSSTHRVSPDTGNNEGGCHGDGDYEEIMERPLQSYSDAATSTIYATANLPTSYSDSPHYANFHKIPRFPDEARVTITKEGRCPNDATASIAKVGISSCDYATVNFGQSPVYSTVNHPHSSSEAPPIYSTISKPRDT